MEEDPTPEERQQILDWFHEGKIQRAGVGYYVPSEAFLLGITPRMVHQVLGSVEELNQKQQVQCPECGRIFNLLDDDDAAEWYYGHDCEV